MPDYVDVSSNNGTPDLAAYWRAGHTDLMLKATEGTGYAWDGMQALAREWHAKGGRVGYYHWLYGTISGAAQHAWFWQHVAPVFKPGDWMMTDFEDVDPSRWVSDAAHLAVVRQFDSLCQQHGPTHDYAPNWYIASMPQCVAYFKTRPIVESDYTNSPPANPYGLRIVAHQYTDRATVPGFSGPVDCNRWLVAEPDSATAKPLVTASSTTEDDMQPEYTIYRVTKGQNLGWEYLVSATKKAVHVAEVDLVTETFLGNIVNPGKPKACVLLQIENHDRFIDRLTTAQGA